MTAAWTQRTTRGKGSAFVGEWSLSARAVDEDADAQRLVVDEVAEESLARIGMYLGGRDPRVQVDSCSAVSVIESPDIKATRAICVHSASKIGITVPIRL